MAGPQHMYFKESARGTARRTFFMAEPPISVSMKPLNCFMNAFCSRTRPSKLVDLDTSERTAARLASVTFCSSATSSRVPALAER